MTVVSIGNALHDGIMRTRLPCRTDGARHAAAPGTARRSPWPIPGPRKSAPAARSRSSTPRSCAAAQSAAPPAPSVHLLSNRLFGDADGGGLGVQPRRYRRVALARDRARLGQRPHFLRDIESAAVWSATYQPCGTRPDSYNVMFAEDRAELVRRDGTRSPRRSMSWSRPRTMPRSGARVDRQYRLRHRTHLR